MTDNEKINFIHGYMYARAEILIQEDPELWKGYTVEILVEQILRGVVNNESKKSRDTENMPVL